MTSQKGLPTTRSLRLELRDATFDPELTDMTDIMEILLFLDLVPLPL